jgi:hypothetical protein
METTTTCTGTWLEDFRIMRKVEDFAKAHLTEDEKSRIPTLTVMRCSAGCRERMVIVGNQRIERLEAMSADHPDYQLDWIDAMALHLLSCITDAGSVATDDGWDDSDADGYDDDAAMDEAMIRAERDWWNDLAFENAEARRRDVQEVYF